MRLAVLLALPLLAGAANGAEQAYLFDVLRQPHFRASWDKLMKDVQPTPDWLTQFNRNFDGAAGQMSPLTIEGKDYQISYVCKPTDCSGRRFEVLFDADGAHAYGALGGKNDSPAFFGAPPQPMEDALAKGVKG